MCVRKLIIVAILYLLFIPNVYADIAENYEWQMSDSAEFTSYEPCGYGKELVLTKDLYGKYMAQNGSREAPRGRSYSKSRLCI